MDVFSRTPPQVVCIQSEPSRKAIIDFSNHYPLPFNVNNLIDMQTNHLNAPKICANIHCCITFITIRLVFDAKCFNCGWISK